MDLLHTGHPRTVFKKKKLLSKRMEENLYIFALYAKILESLLYCITL